MNLLDLLVKELPEFDGWPDGYFWAAQDRDSELCFYEKKPKYIKSEGGWDPLSGEVSSRYWQVRPLAIDHDTAIITQEEYEAALAAKTEPVAWSGERLPPVGTVCVIQNIIEVDEDDFDAHEHCPVNLWKNGQRVEVLSHKKMDDNGLRGADVLVVWNIEKCLASGILKKHLAPIPTPEQIEAERRNRVIKQLDNIYCIGANNHLDGIRDIYEAIRAGKIEGVKIDE